ncbi:Chloramphenicol phosphotransferase-like protein [Streptomyces sp. YIM 130001]|uniref:AAA family ATPase n=1 Tax=Streptomyces sp. YIM 130001 TaxID=2259644 RepID=UPI000E64E8A7|nr:AAA family ATPase [Streptomyces sp. YIM 130001]RII17108.1 Chloramphenicol phosphotransferase-like protein [Streptomyces sp. YIM 130001]
MAYDEPQAAQGEQSPPEGPADGVDGLPGELVLLTGPPGAGKSTVAQTVVQDRSPSVYLHADDFWACIRNGVILPYLPEADRQNRVVINALVETAFAYATGGYRVVLDGVVGPWFLEPFRVRARATGIPLHYVVLRPDEATTLRRGTNRGPDALTDVEPLRQMHGQFADLGPYEPHAVDTTKHTSEETVRTLLRALADDTFRLS